MESISVISIRLIKSLIAAFLISGGMLLFFAYLMFRYHISDVTLSLAMIFAYIAGNVVGGIVMCRQCKKHNIIFGGSVGIMYAFILIFTGILTGNVFNPLNALLITAMCVIGAIFGGIVS